MTFKATRRSLLIVPLVGMGLLDLETALAQETAPITGDVILVPEPSAWGAVFGGYELDKVTTIAHYDAMFRGHTAEEVIRFLRERGQNPRFVSDDEISTIVERLVGFVYYRVAFFFRFEDGVYAGAEIWASGIK
jgi:hypothetical protein